MELDSSVNRTDFTNTHLCDTTDATHLLTRTHSILCSLFHVVLGLLSIVTICGNLFVIISIIYFKQLHTPTNSLILSLAVADLLVGALVFPLTMKFSATTCLYHSDLFCRIRQSFDGSLCTSSILNLCCISIDRYYAVCQPLTYTTKISDHVVVSMILVSWGVAALVGLGLLTVGTDQEECGETCLMKYDVMAKVLGLVFSFYFPLFVMLCIYLKIFTVAQRQARSIQSTQSGAAVSKMERKATKTLATVMGVFLMCWLPFFLYTTLLSFIRVYVPHYLVEILNWLALSNSTINPFIYAFFYSWFRSAFRMIMSGKIFKGDYTNTKLL